MALLLKSSKQTLVRSPFYLATSLIQSQALKSSFYLTSRLVQSQPRRSPFYLTSRLVRSQPLRSPFYLTNRLFSNSTSSCSRFSTIAYHYESSSTGADLTFSGLFNFLKCISIMSISNQLMCRGKRTPFKDELNSILIKRTMPTFMKPSRCSLDEIVDLADFMNRTNFEITAATLLKAIYLDTTLKGLINRCSIEKAVAILFMASEKRTSSPETTVEDLIRRHIREIKNITLLKTSEEKTSPSLRELINRRCIEQTASTILMTFYLREARYSDPETALKETMIKACILIACDKISEAEDTKSRYKVKSDQKAMCITVNVPADLATQDMMVFYCGQCLVLIPKVMKFASDQLVKVIKNMPEAYYSPNEEVTGRIIEGGKLEICLPYGEKEERKESKFFQVNMLG